MFKQKILDYGERKILSSQIKRLLTKKQLDFFSASQLNSVPGQKHNLTSYIISIFQADVTLLIKNTCRPIHN